MTDEGLVDTNILIYSIDKDEGRKHKIAADFLEKATVEKKFFLSVQNLAEFHYNVTKKIPKPVPKEYSQELIRELFANFHLLRYDENTILNAINLEVLYKIHFWDALLAATMQENNLKTIYTENTSDFKKVPWLSVVNPLK